MEHKEKTHKPEDVVYFVEYRTPHFGLREPDKDILQVIKLQRFNAEKKQDLGKQYLIKQLRSTTATDPIYEREVESIREAYEKIQGERSLYITPMGRYTNLPLILEEIPSDFRTYEEFWQQRKFW